MIRIFGRIARNMDGTPLFALDIDPALYSWTIAGAIAAGVLAAAAPARRAAHLDPAQAIRS
jgi:lipoprotein-releasing system permease protein